ncbi:hypothetical protein HanRHA438_Chr02g0067131 [Helianthus annuus]|nr:hypothetical protein HanRHA438_Chr02g0067131 [Helianthus annuus]
MGRGSHRRISLLTGSNFLSRAFRNWNNFCSDLILLYVAMSAEQVIGFGSLRSISPQMPCNLI